MKTKCQSNGLLCVGMSLTALIDQANNNAPLAGASILAKDAAAIETPLPRPRSFMGMVLLVSKKFALNAIIVEETLVPFNKTNTNHTNSGAVLVRFSNKYTIIGSVSTNTPLKQEKVIITVVDNIYLATTG
mmetsp:Transcript_20886/g.25332  ORF Transcript_20886/g.25332 Transcript_20886/m.25332 type:complete len:131 (+) Transcript_20886:1414-1806(+)